MTEAQLAHLRIVAHHNERFNGMPLGAGQRQTRKAILDELVEMRLLSFRTDEHQLTALYNVTAAGKARLVAS